LDCSEVQIGGSIVIRLSKVGRIVLRLSRVVGSS